MKETKNTVWILRSFSRFLFRILPLMLMVDLFFHFFFSSNAFHKISFHYFWLYSARQRSSASINWKLERKQKLYSVMKTFTIALNIQPNLFRGSDSLSLKTLVVKDTITFRPNCSFFSFSNINRRKLFYIFCSLLILLLFIFLFYIYFNFPF